MSSEIRSQFIRSLFDSETIDALQLLQKTLKEKDGFDFVVECLTAWQDLIDGSGSPLLPLLETMKDEHTDVVEASLTLLTDMVSRAGDYSKRLRMTNELTDLQFEKQLSQLKLHWHAEKHISSLLDNCFNVLRNVSEDSEPMDQSLVDDHDVGGEEDGDILEDLKSLLEEEGECGHERLVVVQSFLNTLRNIRNKSDAETTLKRLQVKDSNSNFVDIPPILAPVQPPAAPPPPPPAPKVTGGPPPPPPPPSLKSTAAPGAPPPPPPAFGKQTTSVNKTVELPEAMRPKKIPDKAVKMKTLMWSKIAPSAVVGQSSDNVWSQLASEARGLSLDFDMIEGMFSLSAPTSNNSDSSNNHVIKRKETVVDLLTPKRSQNVTITLKRFKDLDGLLSDLRENRVESFDCEMLRTLKAILPDEDEIDALRRYSGDVAVLSTACSFFLQILAIPDYRLRIDSMLLRQEFMKSMEEIQPQLELLLQTCQELGSSPALRRLLLVLVNIGNYLNGATAHGNAAGFKLNSLWKMIDLKAAKGGSTLLHAVARMDPRLLNDLESELSFIHKASQISIEEIRGILKQLSEQSTSLERQMTSRLQSSPDNFFSQMSQFLKNDCKQQLTSSQHSLDDVITKQSQLAIYFCENTNTFRLEECLRIFSNFIHRLRQAVTENKEKDDRLARKAATPTTEVSSTQEVTHVSVSSPQSKENLLFATLEKGGNNPSKIIRRRPSAKPSLDITRDREEGPGDVKLRRLREDKEDQENREDEQPKEPARVIRRPRMSVHYEQTNDLSEYIQSLEASVTPKTPRSPPADVISVSIPESDGCSSTPGSSPKSGASDEGFESEKDKAQPETCVPIVRTSTSKQVGKAPQKVDHHKPKSTAAPRLVGIRATVPPESVQKSRPLTSSRNIPKLEVTKTTKLSPPSTIRQKPTTPVTTTTTSKLTAPRRTTTTTTTRPSTTSTSTSKSPSATTSPLLTRQQAVRKASVVSNPQTPTATPRTSLVANNRRQSLLPPRPLLNRSTTTTTSEAKVSSGVSTSSRPALIKTGSLSQRPSLKGMDTVEKPRPLKKTSLVTPTPRAPLTRSMTVATTTKLTTGKPKWV